MVWGTHEDVLQRVERLEIPFNGLGVDAYGISKPHLRRFLAALCWFYRNYFRVQVHGIEHVPARGRAMLIGNHSGGLPLDGGMVIASAFLEMNPPRLVQGMVEKFFNRLPFASQWSCRTGQLTGLPEHAVRLLEDDRLLMVFPEGARGTAKLFPARNSLVDFGTGFVRLALQTKAPIVPFAFLGGGEAIPTVVNLYALAKLLGTPYVPITPYLLPLPLPVRLDIHYGPPLVLQGTGNEDDETIASHVSEVKRTIASLIERTKRLRRGWPELGRAELNRGVQTPSRTSAPQGEGSAEHGGRS
jgi:1-acyl-sn-glycerol-3-phosphate acyltransferase